MGRQTGGRRLAAGCFCAGGPRSAQVTAVEACWQAGMPGPRGKQEGRQGAAARAACGDTALPRPACTHPAPPRPRRAQQSVSDPPLPPLRLPPPTPACPTRSRRRSRAGGCPSAPCDERHSHGDDLRGGLGAHQPGSGACACAGTVKSWSKLGRGGGEGRGGGASGRQSWPARRALCAATLRLSNCCPALDKRVLISPHASWSPRGVPPPGRV